MYMLLYGTGKNYFEVRNIHYKSHWNGLGPENQDFSGPKIACEPSSIWAQKS